MSSVYLIVKEAKGAAGHGQPGEPYLALATDGDYPDLGNPIFGFTSYKAAEKHRLTFSFPSFYKVIDLSIREET